MTQEEQPSGSKTQSKKKRKPTRKRSWLRRILLAAVALAVLGAVAGAIAVVLVVRHFGADVPDVTWATNYRPPIVSDVFSGDDQHLGEFYNERRRVVPYERIPKQLVQAFIAAEDVRFFDHAGLDVLATARALVGNAIAGRKKSGASTLTQQTAKAILISTWGYERATAKTYERKIYEAILARRLEQNLSKEQILHLYLNQVFLGHHSYGVQAAAENYFRKNVWDLTLPEMSLLAGLPQAPSRYSPFRFPDRAKKRREYVLGRMLDVGMISQAEYDASIDAEVVVHPVEDVFRETAPYVTEHVRRDLVERYGNDRLLNDGLKVYSTVDLDLEREAIASTLKGLLEADKRQGYRGPLMKLEPDMKAQQGSRAWREAVSKKIDEFRKVQSDRGAAPEGKLEPETTYVGVVLDVSRDGAKVAIGEGIEGVIPLDLIRWARKPNSEAHFRWVKLDAVTDALAMGDVVLVRAATAREQSTLPKSVRDSGLLLMLEQEVSLQGALVAMDPKSGYIVAMIGGYDFNKSEFNRAFQACRQPGSAFKPIVYSAALDGQVRVDDRSCRGLEGAAKAECEENICTEKQRGVWDRNERRCRYTPATLILDAPMVHDDEVNQVRWKPSNFGHEFKGDVTLREALILSMNTPAVRTLEAVGAHTAVQWAKKLGITANLNEDLSIALGSSCVTLWDLTHVYALLNQNGQRVRSTFIRRVVDRDGRVLEDHSAYFDPWVTLDARLAAGYAALFEQREQVMDPVTAFITTNLLRQVTRPGGTAPAAARIGRALAGKTGTTNDAFDAWFMGYSPELVAGVWVGYDTYETPMGRYETGGRTALPIWVDFMEAALQGRPQSEFTAPEGITWVSIDPATGKLAGEHSPSVREPFRIGTEPKVSVDAAPPPAEMFFHEEF